MNKYIFFLVTVMLLNLSAETLFQVKDSSDNVVMDVSTDGLRIFNEGDTLMVISSGAIKAFIDQNAQKGLARSFSVTSSTNIKAGQANVMEVTTDATTLREGELGERYTDFSPKNIFLGSKAGASTTVGDPHTYSGLYNLYIGNLAGQYNTSGYFNTFTGYMAGNASTTSTHNTFYGYQAGMNNDTGSYNTAIGFQAGYEMSGGYNNNVIGYRAGYLTTSGHDNVFMGTNAGYSTTSGDYNIALGYNSGYSLTGGNSNIFMGNESGYSNTYGHNNLFFGYQSGYNTTDGDNNIFLGYQAGMSNTAGNNNQFMGYMSGQSNTSGSSGLFLGWKSGQDNTVGDENLFVGYNSGNSNVSGMGNVILGTYSGQNFTDGNENVMIGRGAGAYASTSASNNVFVGSYAGYGNGSNTGNVFLGYKVGYNNVGSNKLMIDNYDGANENTSLIFGDFFTNELKFNTSNTQIVHPSGTSNGFYIRSNYNGNTDSWHFYQYTTKELALFYNTSKRGDFNITSGAYTSVSDKRLKKNIENYEGVLKNIMLLEPKRYNFKDQNDKDKKFVGLLAQDVEKLFPEFVYYSKEDDTYTMDYAGLSVVAIQAIKEQQSEIEELKAQIKEIRDLIEQ